MNHKIASLTYLPKVFWTRINTLLDCPETVASKKENLTDNPEIRKTLVELAFFPEILN